MTNALSFLNDLAQWLARWIPRMELIQPTHRGVLFGPRGSARELAAGLRIYWPITHALVLLPVTTQSVHLCSQMLPDETATESIIPRVRLCATAIQFRITDAVKAATQALHVMGLVDNRATAAIARHYTLLSADRQAWAASAVDDLRAELEPYGIFVERLDFTGFAIGVALKNVSDWNYGDNTNGTRPE